MTSNVFKVLVVCMPTCYPNDLMHKLQWALFETIDLKNKINMCMHGIMSEFQMSWLTLTIKTIIPDLFPTLLSPHFYFVMMLIRRFPYYLLGTLPNKVTVYQYTILVDTFIDIMNPRYRYRSSPKSLKTSVPTSKPVIWTHEGFWTQKRTRVFQITSCFT